MTARNPKRARVREDRKCDILDFKSAFKYYKRKEPPPCLDNVLRPGADSWSDLLEPCDLIPPASAQLEGCHTTNPAEWRGLRFKAIPGLTVLQGVFSPADQHYWAEQCLKSYSGSHYKRNIDHPCMNIQVGDWYQEAVLDRSLVDKLRWSTLGYHHDWDTKKYSEENRGKFPERLSKLSCSLALALGHKHFTAQAAIVNYYPTSSSLSGHTDHSEENLTAPLLSISLGQPAIFLIGGSSLAEVPTAVLLRSGDVLLMERDSRLAYHAVPRILAGPAGTEQDQDFVQETFQCVTSVLAGRTQG